MTNNKQEFKCEGCHTFFGSEGELMEHESFARHRRPSSCWQ